MTAFLNLDISTRHAGRTEIGTVELAADAETPWKFYLCGRGAKTLNRKAFKSIFLPGLLLFFCWLGHSVAQDRLLFDLKAVADKSIPDVEKTLGKASKVVDDVFRGTRGSTYPAIRATYMNGAVEITFLEGAARYLTIWIQKLPGRYQEYSYRKDGWSVLGDLGLNRNTTADLSNQATTRWRNLPGIYEINIFPTAENKIWYVHILTNRIYE